MNALPLPEAAALARLRALLHHTEARQARERAVLAQRLDGELGALLVAVQLELGWLERRLAPQPELARKCASLGALLDAAVAEVGRLGGALRPRLLQQPGLWAALEALAHDVAQRHGLQADVLVHVQAGLALPGAAQDWADAVWRSAEALLDNVVRHAGARTLRMRLLVEAPLLLLEVEDDGRGFDPVAAAPAGTPAAGGGLAALRERVAHLGGCLRIASVPGHTAVRLTLPLPAAAGEGAP